MLIVPIDNVKEGMILAKDVASTTAKECRTLLRKGMMLNEEMIAQLRTKGIKSVTIIGGNTGMTADIDVEADVPEPEAEAEETAEEVKNRHISNALSELSDIFDCNAEIRELSHEAVEKVDDIANDIYVDIIDDSSYLGNQMIALQNYDDYTYKHCLRVSMLSTAICGELGMDKDATKDVIVAGLLHDIGKSNIDHDIIIKPGKLTDAEFAEIKQHPLMGYNILKKSNCYSEDILQGVLFHHEKYDGSGYPTGISGEKIPIMARILAVADVFDALTSNRPYRKPWSVAETEEYMYGGGGTHFDYDVISAFLRAFNPYPVGTMVQLSDGRHGVVIRHNTNVLRPVVMVMENVNRAEIDLSNDFKSLSIMITGIYGGDYCA